MMQRRMYTILALPALLLMLGVAQAEVIVLASSAEVDASGVRFGDLVAPGKSLPAGWHARSVADVPQNANSWTLRLSEVARMLHQYEDMHHVVLRGQPEIAITVRVETIAYERLEDAVMAYVQQAAQWQDRRFQICRSTIVLPQLPSGEDWAADIVSMAESGRGVVAHATFASASGRVWEQGEIELPLVEVYPYWQAGRPLLRGITLAERDLQVRWLRRAEGARYLPADDPIVGMELRRNLQAGQMIVLGSLAEPVYARRGEVVRVQLQQGGMTVTLRARALSDGRRDERIPCLNERSGRRLYVRMVSPREGILEGGSES